MEGTPREELDSLMRVAQGLDNCLSDLQDQLRRAHGGVWNDLHTLDMVKMRGDWYDNAMLALSRQLVQALRQLGIQSVAREGEPPQFQVTLGFGPVPKDGEWQQAEGAEGHASQ